MEFKVSGSGAESKTADIARQFNKPSGGRLMSLIISAVEKCEEEVLSGLNLNPCDLWLYCTAMRALSESLEKCMNEDQHAQYARLIGRLEATTIMADVTRSEEEENAD